MQAKLIYETPDRMFRIMEHEDTMARLDDLKGDSYNPEVHPDICPVQLKREEQAFERTVEINGVFGYTLEKWDALPGVGYEQIDSCWGFVSDYASEQHYIVEEFKRVIEKEIAA